jgi:D-alanine-D-alanine ligase
MSSIIVLSGSTSKEREVSLRSGTAVANALRTLGHIVTVIDPSEDFLAQKDTVQAADVVFPALHGTGGEDGEIQKILESWGVAFVGSDSQASFLCLNKDCYKELMLKNNVLIPRGEVVNANGFAMSKLSKKPFVLKPYDGGSSVDTLIVRDVAQFNSSRLEPLFAKYSTLLLEELIEGDEITVGVLGEQPLPVIEIIPPESGEFDYENKYNGMTQELCPPLHVNESLQQQAQEITLHVHKLCNCRDLSRSDFIITKNGEIYLLETNTIPGMTEQSLFPKAAAAAGMPMAEAMEKLVQLALARKHS